MPLRKKALPLLLFAVVLAGLLALSGCSYSTMTERLTQDTSPAPNKAWTPPKEDEKKPAVKAPGFPENLFASKAHWTLADVIDLALRNNPATRAAWLQALSAAANVGEKKGAYYPTLDLNVDASRVGSSAIGGQFNFTQSSWSPTAQLSYLLFDFGGRKAKVDEAREALIAANWSHNTAIQTVILNVETAYYQYMNARALAEAQQTALKQAETNLEAAKVRHQAGLGTIADVLQAKTALSQSQLKLETYEGQMHTIRGGLATAIGLPANTPFNIQPVSKAIPVVKVTDKVSTLIDKATMNRPDLESLKARAREAQAHVRSVKASRYPSLELSGQAGRLYYLSPTTNRADTYNAQLSVKIPLFDGMIRRYQIIGAEADAKQAQAQFESLEDQVVYQVWASFYTLKTAEKRLSTSRDLLASAKESYDVALGRYKAGVGSILDLLSAQSALEDARAQAVQARTDWLQAVAQLAYDTGTLKVHSPQTDVMIGGVEKKGKP